MKNLRRNLVLTITLGIAIMIGLSGSVNATPILTFNNTSSDASTTTATNGTDSTATLNTTTPTTTTTNTTTNTNTSGTTGNVTLSTTNTSSNRVTVNNVDTGKDLPQTGENDIYIVTAVGAIALVIGGVAYMKSRKYDM